MENINSKKHLAAIILLVMWAVAMYNSILMDIQFQNSFATTDGEHSTATRMGFIMPIIGGLLLIPIAELYRKQKIILWSLGMFMFTLLTAYQLHGNLGYFANQNESYESNGSVTTFLKSQLNAVDNQISATKPIAGNFDSTAIEAQIASNLTALEKCPKNHATVCINPIRNKLNALYEKRELASNAGSANMQIAMAVKSRGELIKQLTVSSSELDNAKAHPAFKAGSMFFTGSISSAKEYQAKFLSWQSVLLLLICETLPAIIFGMLDISVSGFIPTTLPSFLRTRAVASSQIPQPNEQPGAARASMPADIPPSPSSPPVERGHGETDVVESAGADNYSGSSIGFSAAIPQRSIPMPVADTRMDIPVATQSSSDTPRGIAADLEYEAIKTAILDGSYFDFEDVVGTNAIRRYTKMTSPSGKGVGQTKAIRFVEYAKNDRLPMTKAEFESRKGGIK